MNICEQIGFLKVIYILKQLLNVLIIVLPLILTIFIMIDIIKVIINNPEKLNDAISKSINRFIAAVVIFFIPTIIMSLFRIVSDNVVSINLLCINNASSEYINKLEITHRAEIAKLRSEEEKEVQEAIIRQQEQKKLQEQQAIERELKRASSSSGNVTTSGSTTPFVNGTQRALQTGDCMSWSDNCYCPTKGNATGFHFIMASETGRNMADTRRNDNIVTVSEECSDGKKYSVRVNSKVANNYKDALSRICKLETSGINGIKLNKESINLQGTVSERTNSARTICSFHAYGTAIDVNYSLEIDVNGTKYKPYASQGYSTRNAYNQFVNAIGSEANIKNVNYILWIYAFKPAGFNWGGNWGDSYFDPMHFEIS